LKKSLLLNVESINTDLLCLDYFRIENALD
jgi:hypothetical protein